MTSLIVSFRDYSRSHGLPGKSRFQHAPCSSNHLSLDLSSDDSWISRAEERLQMLVIVNVKAVITIFLVTLHVPRIQDPFGTVTAYSIEHLLRNIVESAHVDTYVYVFFQIRPLISASVNLYRSRYYFPRSPGLVKRTTSMASFILPAHSDGPPLKRQRTMVNLESEKKLESEGETSESKFQSSSSGHFIRAGQRFYLFGLGSAADRVKREILDKGGVIDAKMSPETQFIVTEKSAIDSLVAMLLAKNSDAKILHPSSLK